MTIETGIDGIGVAVPGTYIALADLAVARNVPPTKYTEGLGTVEMAVPLEDEDTVSLAVRAARAALASAGVSPAEIGLCVVGTETAVDHSKPTSAFVHGLLGLARSCRVFETKHACYGGTAALQIALDWIRAGTAAGRKALVICSDIARYGLHTAGEPTQGAGAVAMVVSASPRILAIDAAPSGTYARDVFDFWRPLYAKDAVVDGHYSVECYLDALKGAYGEYRGAARALGDDGEGFFSDRFASLVYHVPYGKMARKAHRAVRELDGDASPDASFAARVASSLVLPSRVGNIYTGSMYLALASVLSAPEADLTGKRVGLFSYGSGCCAEFYSGVVQPEAHARVRALQIGTMLDARRRLSVSEYEAVMNAREHIDEQPATDPREDASGVRFLGVREHRRVYG